VDMAWDIPPAKWKEIDADPNLNLNFGERYDPMFLSLSPNIEPYSDINLRRALIKAFPYETVVREVLGGFSEPRSSFSREREPWYKEYDLFSQDLEQAREFLAQSSYEPGTRLILSMYENDPTDVAVWYQQALNEIGVSVEIQELPLAAWTEQRTTQQLPFLIHQLQSWIPDFSYYAGLSWKEPDNYSNTAGWKNQRAFEIVPEALEILNYDDPRVIELWEEMQDMVAQDAVYAPLFSYGTAMPAKKEIKGYNFVFYSPGADLRSLSREK
jgi:peptide/nickel transport system substrate-binding protein